MTYETGSSSALTPLQRQIYDSANHRYAAKHFSTASVEIVDSEPSHYEPIKGLSLRAYEPVVPTMYSDGYSEQLTDIEGRAKSAKIYTALLNGHIVGTITYVKESSSPLHVFADTSAVYLRYLAVDPSAHRLGAGRLLTERCLDEAVADQMPAVGLHTLPAMSAAMGLYKSLGFVRSKPNDGLTHVGYHGEAPAFIKTLP